MMLEERRLLTILFADLSGFTALSANLDPEDVQEVASTCFEHLNRSIVKHAGTIHKYEGDLVIALFGYPSAHEDDPERAIQAALEMMRIIPELNRVLASKLRQKIDLGLHVGINMGTVVTGEIGSKAKKEYTVMGDVVNLTSRLKDVAQRDEIIVSESVFRASRYLFDYEARPAVPIKGVKESIKVYRPLNLRQNPDPKRGVQGLISPMIGRNQELGVLKQAASRLAGGKGGIAFILGGAGLGKSRLIEELKTHLTGNQSPITQLVGRCLSYGEEMPYWPFLQVLENLFNVTEDDTRKVFQEKLVKRAREIFPEDWVEIIPYLGYLFSIRFAEELDEKVKFLDAQGLKVQIMVALKKLLMTLARSQPILLIIDDYHWIDQESLELLEFIFNPPPGCAPDLPPILLVALSRIEKDAPHYKTKEQFRKTLPDDCLEIVLKPLDAADSTTLVYNLLNVPGITAAFKDKILVKAEGNPFYVEEILRSLIDNGILVYTNGIWSLSRGPKELENIKIPDTVQAVIAARLDKLTQDVRDVLQMAAVVGRNFRAPILEQLCSLDSLMLSVHLATLEEYEYISGRKKDHEEEYSFRHPLLQEVAYSGLLMKRRRELHRKTGELIEKIYHDRLDEFTDVLAHQYSNSDDIGKALEWMMKAGLKAKARYANEEAIKYFDKMVVLAKAEPGREKGIGPTYEALAEVYSLKADYGKALEGYDSMFNCSDDKIVQCRAKRMIAETHLDQNHYDDSLKIADEIIAEVTAPSTAEMAEKAELHILKSRIMRAKGDPKRAFVEGEQGMKIVEELAQHLGKQPGDSLVDVNRLNRIRMAGLNSLAESVYDLGDLSQTLELNSRSLQIAEKLGDKMAIGRGLQRLGSIYSSMGEIVKSIEFYKRSQETAQEIGDKRSIALILSDLASIAKDKGDYQDAIDLYEQAHRICIEIGVSYGAAAASANMGAVYQMLGDLDKAQELYETNVKVFKAIGAKRPVATSLSFLGDVAKEKGAYDRAIEYFLEALNGYEEIGDQRGLGATFISLGSAYLDKRDPGKAGHYLQRAEEVLRNVGDPFELLRLYAYRAELGVFEMRQSGSFEPRPDILEYLEKGVKSSRDLQTKYGEAVFYMILGEYYGIINDFKKAEEKFEAAVEILARINFKKMLAEVHLEYGRMLKKGIQQKVYPSGLADIQFDKAVAIFKELKVDHRIKAVETYRSS